MNDQKGIRTFFVYGTLKRGECREHSWPVPPESVTAATTRGQLYDLGKYPAMTSGDESVAGELWRIPESGLEETLRVLDAIEGYCAGDDRNLYDRLVIKCLDANGLNERAYAYFYVNPLPDECRIRPQAGKQTIRWSHSK